MTAIDDLAVAARQLAAGAGHLPAGGIELAYHAAVPVVVDPELLHLIRLNFLVDGAPHVPYEVEAPLLLSPLFREVAGGLFEIDPGVRNLLLLGLNSAFGAARVEGIATLLDRYALRPHTWNDYPALEKAQRVTAYSLLDPRGAEAWLERNQPAAGPSAALGESWFVAMRQRRESYPPLEATFDPVIDQVVRHATADRSTAEGILRCLAPLPGAGRAATALAQLTGEQAAVAAERGPAPVDADRSPWMARRQVRLAVRAAREELGLPQAQVAEEMEWSLSKVIRIESGEVSISPNDLRMLLSLLRVKDRERVQDLVALARAARARTQGRWWDRTEVRGLLPTELIRLADYEEYATTVFSWSPMTVPDFLQTHAYSLGLLKPTADDEASPEVLAALLQAQRLRRQTFLERRPALRAVIDEAAVRRVVGSPEIMRAQLLDLERNAGVADIRVRVLPFSAPVPRPPYPFELLDFGRTDFHQAAHVSRGSYGELIDSGPEPGRFARLHQRLWEAAYDEQQSAELIAGVPLP